MGIFADLVPAQEQLDLTLAIFNVRENAAIDSGAAAQKLEKLAQTTKT